MVGRTQSKQTWWKRMEVNRRLANIPGSTIQAAHRLGIYPIDTRVEEGVKKYMFHCIVVVFLFLSPYIYAAIPHHDYVKVTDETESDLGAFIKWKGISQDKDSGVPDDILSNMLKERLKINKSVRDYQPGRDGKIDELSDMCQELPTVRVKNKRFGGICLKKVSSSKNNGNEHSTTSIDEKYNREEGVVLKEKRLLPKILTLTALFVASCGFLAISLHHIAEASLPVFIYDAIEFWERIERILMRQNNIMILLKQSIFLGVCEKVLLPDQFLSSLYTLMFLTIITYCLSYANEIYQRTQWNLCITIGSPEASVRHLALSTTNIVLEWTKAVTFITTVVLVLLVMGLEKGLNNYTPTVPYIIIAVLFWICSEKICRDVLMSFLMIYRIDWFDSLEEYYFPLLMASFQCSMLAIFTLPCFFMGNLKLGLLGSILSRVEYLNAKHLYINLLRQLLLLQPFRVASAEELSQLNDRCSICLSDLKSARVTPCQHFYHADCLLQLIKVCGGDSPKCPICQTDFNNL